MISSTRQRLVISIQAPPIHCCRAPREQLHPNRTQSGHQLLMQLSKKNKIAFWHDCRNPTPKARFHNHTFVFSIPSAGGRGRGHQVLCWSITASLTHSFPPSLHTFLPHLHTHFLPLSSSPSFTTAASLNGRSDSDTKLTPQTGNRSRVWLTVPRPQPATRNSQGCF